MEATRGIVRVSLWICRDSATVEAATARLGLVRDLEGPFKVDVTGRRRQCKPLEFVGLGRD